MMSTRVHSARLVPESRDHVAIPHWPAAGLAESFDASVVQAVMGNRALGGLLAPGRAGAGAGSAALLRSVIADRGTVLDPDLRAFMEEGFAHDFSDVRVHADADAADSAEAVHARAYTVGRDVVIGRDQPSLETAGGRHLLAHELAHVVQQRRGGPAPAGPAAAGPEREADAAATAVATGAKGVAVGPGTGVGLARQPKDKSVEADIDIDKVLSTPKAHGITDPRSSPRYIDKLFQSVTYSGFTGASVFKWQEDGKEQQVGVPLVDLEQDDTKSFLPILDIYNSRAEALKVVLSYPTKAFKVYTFYRTPGGVIMPTTFSIHSTPEFHKLWPGLRQGLREKAAEIRAALVPIANAVNPIPGTKVDEYGDLSLSGNPLDWLGLLKLRRLKKIKEAGPITRKLHSGYGVPYTVLGPHGKLSGTSVYVLKDAQGTVLYVGKGDALSRLREHIKDPNKTQWFGEIAHVEVWGTGLNNTRALALEENLIGQLGPAHNVDRFPFKKEFGNTMAVGPNLPAAQKVLTFWLEWGH